MFPSRRTPFPSRCTPFPSRRTLVTAVAVLVPLATVAIATPAAAATGLTASFTSANNGSWFQDKYIVANDTSAAITGYANLVASVPGCTVFHDEQAVATYCYTGNQWWTFDDAWSIGRKTAWVRSKGLLGVMIWEMSGDSGTLMGAVDGGLR